MFYFEVRPEGPPDRFCFLKPQTEAVCGCVVQLDAGDGQLTLDPDGAELCK